MEWRRARPGPLIGLLGGVTGTVIAVSLLVPTWLAGPGSADTLFHLHGWFSTPMIVGGYAFGATGPSRQPSALDRAMSAHVWARPRRVFAGFLVGALSWLVPLMLAYVALPQPAGLILAFAWPLALPVEITFAYWWWWRHGRYVEIEDGERTRLIPSALLQPVLWGWIIGTVVILLAIAMIGQIRAAP